MHPPAIPDTVNQISAEQFQDFKINTAHDNMAHDAAGKH
jgi:hypothetical protein